MKRAALLIMNPSVLEGQDLSEMENIFLTSGYDVTVLRKYRSYFPADSSFRFVDQRSLLTGCTLAFSLGGDGSLLQASRLIRSRQIPLVGINFGRLGYLTTLEKNEYDGLKDILLGRYRLERRSLLQARIWRQNLPPIDSEPALNEVVLSNGSSGKMLSFDFYCNGVLTQHYKSDGIIISTPSGSTGYSLAAGGPVLSPTLNCMVATPLCAHSLSARPVVIDAESTLSLCHIASRGGFGQLIVDGTDVLPLRENDKVEIFVSRETIPLVRKTDDSFLSTLHKKLTDHEVTV